MQALKKNNENNVFAMSIIRQMWKTPKNLEILEVAIFEVFTAALLNIPAAKTHKYATNFILTFQLKVKKSKVIPLQAQCGPEGG